MLFSGANIQLPRSHRRNWMPIPRLTGPPAAAASASKSPDDVITAASLADKLPSAMHPDQTDFLSPREVMVLGLLERVGGPLIYISVVHISVYFQFCPMLPPANNDNAIIEAADTCFRPRLARSLRRAGHGPQNFFGPGSPLWNQMGKEDHPVCL